MRWPWQRRERAGDAEYRRLVDRSLATLQVQHAVQHQMLALDDAGWAIDADERLIRFTRPGGVVATAPVQIVGTLDPVHGTWLWAWDHPSVRPDLAEHSRLVRAWGLEHHVAELTTRIVPADDDTAWRFAAVACALSRAQGVRRCPTEREVVLVTIGSVTPVRAVSAPEGPTRTWDPDWTGQLPLLRPVAAPQVVDVVRGWMAHIHEIEAQFREECVTAPEGDPPDDVVDRAIAEKQPVYEQFWRREDEYHRPCSVGAIRWYDVDAMQDWQVYRLDDESWRVTYREPMTGALSMTRAYDVRQFPDGLRIVNHLD
jgi:hypothetical protein